MIHSNHFCGINLLQLLILQGSMEMGTLHLNLLRLVLIFKLVFLAYLSDFYL